MTKPDSIAMGAYTVDVIHVSRYANGSGVWMEGGIQAPSFLQKGLPPFAIPYRVRARSSGSFPHQPVYVEPSLILYGLG